MTLSVDQKAPDFTIGVVGSNAISLSEELKNGPVCLVFLRYLGCPLSRWRLSELVQEQGEFADKNVQVIVVMESNPGRVEGYLDAKGVPLRVVADKERKLYDLYDVKAGGITAMLHPSVLPKAAKAMVKGHMHGAFEGKELQTPAVFVVRQDGNLGYVYYGKHVADTVSTEQILSGL